jgi:hypothetical protein
MTMEATTSHVTRLARLAGRAGLRPFAPPGSVVLVGLLILALAFAAGALVADLLVQESETILAAPFRWHVR